MLDKDLSNILALDEFKAKEKNTWPQPPQEEIDKEIDNIEATPWPNPLAEEAFYSLAGEVVHALEPYTEADSVALLINFLTAFGNVIGRIAAFDVAGDTHFTNLFTLLVGGTSEGRKGSSWAIVKRLFFYLDADWAQYKTPGGLSSGEGLIWQIRDEIKKYDAKQQAEITIDTGVRDKRLLVVESEFAQTLKVMQREGNTLSPIIRSAWDGQTLQSLTKNSQAVATNPHVSIIGQITPEELRTLLSSTEKFNGFVNRFMTVCVRRSKYLPNPPVLPELLLKNLAAKIRASMPTQPVIMRRSPEANTLWEAIYPALVNKGDDMASILTARAEAQVLRLSMIYALLDGSATIQPEHIEAALALWQYVEASTRFIFGVEDNDPISEKILAALKERPLTQTEIYRDVFQCNIPAKKISEALQRLSAKGMVKCMEAGDRDAIRKPKIWSIAK